MITIDLKHITNETKAVAEKAASFISGELGKVSSNDIEEKDLNSLVSYVDKQAELMIVNHLKSLNLKAGFLTEEEVTINDESVEGYRWVIDPLDGTTNFLKGIPHFSVSIALELNGDPIIGVVVDVMRSKTYWAIKGEGAYCNDKSIKASSISEMTDVILVTGFPYSRDFNLDESLVLLKHWLTHCRAIRRLGSAALDLVYVASGKLDAYYESKLNRWDLSAGVLIVTEAGGVVCDYDGLDKHLESGNIVASGKTIFPQIIAPIKNILN